MFVLARYTMMVKMVAKMVGKQALNGLKEGKTWEAGLDSGGRRNESTFVSEFIPHISVDL